MPVATRKTSGLWRGCAGLNDPTLNGDHARFRGSVVFWANIITDAWICNGCAGKTDDKYRAYPAYTALMPSRLRILTVSRSDHLPTRIAKR